MRVGQNRGGIALGDLAAEIQHRDAGAGPGDQIDLVLDQNHCRRGRNQPDDQVAHVAGFRWRHSACGFIQQQQFRLAGKGAREFDTALLRQREGRDGLVAPLGHPNRLDQRLHSLGAGALASRGAQSAA